jgi:hypothetical protein
MDDDLEAQKERRDRREETKEKVLSRGEMK